MNPYVNEIGAAYLMKVAGEISEYELEEYTAELLKEAAEKRSTKDRAIDLAETLGIGAAGTAATAGAAYGAHNLAAARRAAKALNNRDIAERAIDSVFFDLPGVREGGYDLRDLPKLLKSKEFMRRLRGQRNEMNYSLLRKLPAPLREFAIKNPKTALALAATAASTPAVAGGRYALGRRS